MTSKSRRRGRARKANAQHPVIAMTAPVTLLAAVVDDDGKTTSPPKFSVDAYTGGAMTLAGWDLPVVVDLAGMSFSNQLVANLDHEPSKRVGNVTGIEKTSETLVLSGSASAVTEAKREVVESASNGFVWQASIEARPDRITEVADGEKISLNGQDFTGPLYVAAKSTLKGFAFVSHGADDNTSVSIAATADKPRTRSTTMDDKCKQWIEAMGFDVDELDDEQRDALVANYAGQSRPKTASRKAALDDALDAKQLDEERIEAITEIAVKACDKRPYEIKGIKLLANTACDEGWAVDKFRLELMESGIPHGRNVTARASGSRLTDKVLEAAVCLTGRLADVEKKFDDQTLEAADREFPRGIGLNQLLMIGAEAGGYEGRHSREITLEAQRAAFGLLTPTSIRAGGFSTIDIPVILSNVANKFLRQGWNSVDMTPLSISTVRSVRDFKQITTVSLTGDLTYEQVGPSGDIKHGTLGEEVYSNKADTYARMLAITRHDMINDDLNALTDVPMKLGRGGALKLNDIFWKMFLDNGAFFVAGNNNVTTGALGEASLDAANTVFMDQTDPDGNPLGTMPAILLVPTGVQSVALRLMNSELVVGDTDRPDANIWRNRFTVESSPYMSNANYTGNSAVAWYLLANPAELPVIEIAALNGRVEPVVETADADFQNLGVQMRGYSDVGVNLQEFRGGVRSTGA